MLVVRVVVVLAVPPPSGTVTVSSFWLAPRERVGAAETCERLNERLVPKIASRRKILQTRKLSL